MSLMGSVMQNIFGQRPQQPAPIQKQPGNFPVNPEMAPNAANPTVPNNTNEPAEVASPLAPFEALWQTDPNAKAPEPKPALFAGLDPATLAAAAAKNDFTKIITPEMQAALTKGGPEATNVMIQAMNLMAQKGFGDSAVASTKLIEQALAKQQQAFVEMLPNIIKSQSVGETLRSANPMFQSPAVAPILEMMTQQVAAKHPTLTAGEQAKMAQDYVLQFSQAFNPAKPTPQQQATANETDWSSFLS